MSPLRSPNADPSRPSLRQLGAELRSGLARVLRRPPVAPEAPTPSPISHPNDDPAVVAVEGHRAAFAAWKPLGDAYNEATGEAFIATGEAEAEPRRVMVEAFDALIRAAPATPAGLRALAAYLPGAVVEANCVEVEEDAREALRSVCRGVLALVEDPDADAELLTLGRRLEAARDRELTACAVVNAAQEEADRHMPARPTCLTYRASDDELNVYRVFMMMPEALEGIEVGSEDVDRLRRLMPMKHEVLRPIREGERAHIDHPGKRFDIVPHPEAQARAEEIVAAWDAWRAEMRRVYDEYVPERIRDAADEAGEAAADLAHRIADLPARTGAGLRAKLRALVHYDREALPTEIPDEPDPEQLLARSLRRDIERDEAADADEPLTVESAAPLDLIAYTFDDPVAPPAVWLDKCRIHTLGLHIADRTLRMTKLELVAFIREAGERNPITPEAMFNGLDTAQETFEGWGKLLDVARSRYLVAVSAEYVEREAQQAAGGEA